MLDALPAAPVVLLGLAAAVTWGAADFGGGLASRRAPLLGVTFFVQILGIGAALVLSAIRGEPFPGPADLAWAVVAGLAGSAGIAGLYGALAAGQMSVIAPFVAILGASVPVLVGVALQGAPPPIVTAGIGLAFAAVVLVSGAAPGAGAGTRGLRLAVLGGAGIGLFSVFVSRISRELVFGPLVIIRTVATAVFVLLILLGRRSWRLPRPAWGLVALTAVVDLLGNAAFLVATHVGELAVATILSSLYPVATVLLAAIVLRERITARHALGIVMAGIAIALIAGGSA